MNLPNKITLTRIFLAIIVLIILVFPFYEIGFNWPSYLIDGRIMVDFKYILCGILFTIACITDWLDGWYARKYNMVTDFGKTMDAIADKVLVNGTLIILAFYGFLPVIIPVIIISRDVVTDAIKMVAGSKGNVVPASNMAKLKTIFMMVGLILVLFYNLPTYFIGSVLSIGWLKTLALGHYLVFAATVLSVFSGFQYYQVNKDFLHDKL